MKIKHKIRENFRDKVFKRDNYRCKICNRNDVKLDAHHIISRKDIINGGYVLENGITLCDCENGCHYKAEQFLQTNNKNFILFSPENLFKLINSGYEKAYKKSKEL